MFSENPFEEELQKLNQKIDPILELPPEVASHMLSYLEAKDLSKFQIVSKSWFKACDNNILWAKLCLHEWKGKLIRNNNSSNFVVNKTEEIKLTIREMKELLRN